MFNQEDKEWIEGLDDLSKAVEGALYHEAVAMNTETGEISRIALTLKDAEALRDLMIENADRIRKKPGYRQWINKPTYKFVFDNIS